MTTLDIAVSILVAAVLLAAVVTMASGPAETRDVMRRELGQRRWR